MALTLLAANNAQTVLAAGISSSATSLTVNTGTGALFPSPSAGVSFFKLTLIDAATGQLTEILHVTARSGDTMTVLRAQEGTTARAWSANDIVANMLTSGTLSFFAQNESPAFTGTPTAPTPTTGDSTTKLATTAFVAARAPNMARFTTSGSWTCPAGVTTAYLSGCAAGAGGGGGGGSIGSGASSGAGGGGGGGASVIKQPVTVVPGTVYTITIGSGGVGGNGGAIGASGSDGSDGGNTSFGALLTLTGGGRGFGGGGVSPGVLGGGFGGSYGGGGGGSGSATLVLFPVGGVGGSTPFGTPGGPTRNGSSSGSGVVTGTPGYGYGAGGGGGGGQTNSTGGIGSQGQVGLPGLLIVEW